MILYFLVANFYALLFFGFYLLLLKGRTGHSWSRVYLWAATLLSLLLPWIKPDLSAWQGANTIAALQAITLPEVILTPGSNHGTSMFPGKLIWGIGYLVIVYFFLARFIYRFIALQLFLRRQQFIKADGYRLALNTGIGPASFGSAILFPGTEVNPYILNHEKAHLKLRHHYDKLLLQLIRCFFFPVLPLYFISKELALVHEFEADAAAATDKETYSTTLLGEHLDTQNLYFLQSFFHHPLKLRILMLQKNKTSDHKRRGILVFLSTVSVAAILLFQSGTPLAAKGKEIKITDETAFVSVEEMPQFPGDLNQYLKSNLHYPEAAKKAGVQGRVIARFIINKEGAVEDVTIQRGIDPGCDAEAVRVIKAMPRWEPGKQAGKPVNVYYTLPVNFKLAK